MSRRSIRALFGLAFLAAAMPVQAPAVSAGEPYRYRGVIFGPYGRPWTHDDRMSVLAWMGREWRDTGRPRMNIYIHAAKDDVYQRLQWRTPYPADQMAEFTQEITLARAAGVEWVPNVSPGFPLIPSATLPEGVPSRDICFSCPADLEVLVAKLRPFALAGVRTFMISFDDVQKISTHPQDVIAYGVGNAAYGRANADLMNRLRDRLSVEVAPDTATVLTVPAVYNGTRGNDYLTAFGQTLAADIPVMWTGTQVISKEILASQAAAYSAAISTPASGPRKLLIWDNFPVNDLNGNIFSSTGLPTGFKLNMGPYKGRGADLTSVIDGIVSNPMNEAEASKIPLYSVAAYLNDPAAYIADAATCPLDDDVAGCLSEAAWLEGIDEFGGGAAAAIFDFVSQMRSTALDRTESPLFRARWEALQDGFGEAFWREPWAALVAELNDEGAAPETLRASLGNPRFIAETTHHLATLERNVGVGLLASDLLAAMRPSLTATIVSSTGPEVTVAGTAKAPGAATLLTTLVALLPQEVQMRASPYSVHGDRFQHSISEVYIRENQMDAFTGFVHEALLAWLPSATMALTGVVRVTVNGVPASLGTDGAFSITVPAAAVFVVIATDAGGGRTGMTLSL